MHIIGLNQILIEQVWRDITEGWSSSRPGKYQARSMPSKGPGGCRRGARMPKISSSSADLEIWAQTGGAQAQLGRRTGADQAQDRR